MNVIILGTSPSPLEPIISQNGCTVLQTSKPVDIAFLRNNFIGFAVSYRYRHIIKKPMINFLKGNIINLHISLLPWNRGADPNLWSFLDNTPKGITIHYIDQGIDTGDIIAQKEYFFTDPNETLSSTYEFLNTEILKLFATQWPLIRSQRNSSQKQTGSGTVHQLRDKEKHRHLFEEQGWETPVYLLTGKAKKT